MDEEIKVSDVVEVTGGGLVLITNNIISQTDWSEERKVNRIKVITDEVGTELEVKSVELTYKKGKDFLSFVLKQKLTEEDLTNLKGGKVEQIGWLNRE